MISPHVELGEVVHAEVARRRRVEGEDVCGRKGGEKWGTNRGQ